MLSRLLNWISGRFGGGDGEANEDGDAGGDDGRRFVPSRLDNSVREAHGGGSTEAQRELAEMQEQAAEIERQQQHHDR